MDVEDFKVITRGLHKGQGRKAPKKKSKLIEGTGEKKWVRTKDFDEPSLHNYTKYTPLKES